MARKGGVRSSLKQLTGLAEALALKPVIQVGVFTGKSARKNDSDGPTNADIAAAHEFGLPKSNLPPRSILRTPISDHAKEIMAAARAEAETLLIEPLKVKTLYQRIGIACEKVVIRAFDTGGFGKWAQLAFSTIIAKLRRRKVHKYKRTKMALDQIRGVAPASAILIDRGELRRAFSSRVRFR